MAEHPPILLDWRAYRSGMAITVLGKSQQTGELQKISGVYLISPGVGGSSIATLRDGSKVFLQAA